MPSNHSHLRTGALALAAISVGGYLADYAFNLTLTRLLDVHDYGDYRLAFSFAYFCGLAVLLGGDRAAPMVLAARIEARQPRQVWEYLRFYLRNALLLSLGIVAVVWGVDSLRTGAFESGFDHGGLHPIAWASLAIPLNAVAAMVSRTLQSAHRPAEAALPWRIGLHAFQIAILGTIYLLGGQLTVLLAVWIAVGSIAVLTAWQWHRIHSLGLVELARSPRHGAPREWMRTSLPMMGSFLVALALSQSDLYFLELLGDEAEVGHYSAASMAAHLLPLIQVTLVGLLAPLVRPAIDAGPERSRELFRQGLRFLLGLLVPIGLLLALFGEWILSHFGPEYRVGHAVLQFLVVGNFAWATAALSSLWLQYRGRAKAVLVISIATLVADSVLNLLLIPTHGMEGAAGGTALTLGAAALAVLWVHARQPAPPADQPKYDRSSSGA